jgi:hypothetical protein
MYAKFDVPSGIIRGSNRFLVVGLQRFHKILKLAAADFVVVVIRRDQRRQSLEPTRQ